MKYRLKEGGFTLIELVVVVCMIAVLMAVSVQFYQKILGDARKSGLQLLSSHFTSAISMLHVKWIREHQPRSLWLDDETEILLNRRGWPIGARAPYIDNDLGACQQLWEGLFRNPGALPDMDDDAELRSQYRTSRPQKGVCRFQLTVSGGDGDYFDYFSSSGKIKTSLN